MNLIFYRIWLTKSTNFAKFFIVLVFTLCFSSHIRAEITSAEVQEIITILNHGLWSNDPTLNPVTEQLLQSQNDLGNGLGYFLTGYSGPDMDVTSYTHKGTLPYMLQLQYAALTGGKLNASQPTTWNLKDDTTAIVNLLRRLTNSIAGSGSTSSTSIVNVTVFPTNIINVSTPISPDVLAGNPWWSTNSEFAPYWSLWDGYAPRPTSRGWASFPEMMSILSSVLLVPEDAVGDERYDFYERVDAARKSWFDQFGVLGDERRNYREGAYSFYDYVADAFRSNWVASGTYNRNLLSALSALSSVTNSVFLFNTNIVNLFVTNSAGSSFEDILAANPWWATNSNFAFDWLFWNDYFSPWPKNGYPSGDSPTTFPEAFSLLLSSRLRAVYPDWRLQDFWQTFGGTTNSYNVRESNLYTFEDWIADSVRSNLLLTTSPSLTNLYREYVLYDSDDPSPTNVPLPQYSLPSSESVSGASDTLSSAESGLLEKIESLQPHYTGGDDEIVVIPAFSVGGINVREYRARLSTSITPVCRSVASFIWYVGLFAFLFAFAKSEFVYYATLGKFWVRIG